MRISKYNILYIYKTIFKYNYNILRMSVSVEDPIIVCGGSMETEALYEVLPRDYISIKKYIKCPT